MKISNLIILAILVLSFSSCEKDTNDNPTNDMLITGVWKPIKQVSMCSSGAEDSFDYNTCSQTSRTNFLSNGNYNEVFNMETFGNCETEYVDTGTWSIDDSSLTLVLDNQSIVFSIVELNATSLILGLPNTDQSMFCNDNSVISSFNRVYTRVE